MEPIASFSGLASGIQWRDMLEQIIQVERAPARALERRIGSLETRSAAWTTFRGKLSTLETAAESLAAGSAFRTYETAITGYSGASAPLSATTSEEAVEGTYAVTVHDLAAREKLAGAGFDSGTDALGVSGEFLVNGVRVAVSADDGLDDIAAAINDASSELGVRAAVTSTSDGGSRLVITAADAGAAGVDLVDGSSRVLRSLGFLEEVTTLKHRTSDGATSDAFTSSTAAVGDLLSLVTPPPAGTVTVGGESVDLDLSTMGLDDAAAAINDAAALAGKSFSAEVVSGTAEDGSTTYRLDISGTTDVGESGGILEALGVVQGGRGAVARALASGTAFVDGSTGAAATGATALADLEIDGANAGVAAGDTLTIVGTRGDGSTFSLTYTVGAGDTLDDLTTFLAAGSDDFGTGRTATVSIDAGGRLAVTDDTAGASLLGLSISANNEGGGTLDFGEIGVTSEGRHRQITDGSDARVEVDGAFVTSSSNEVSGALPGVTLRLSQATGEEVLLDVSRPPETAVKEVQAFVDAYNALNEWVSNQFGGAGAEEGVAPPPLSGDSTLRTIRNSLREVMSARVLTGVAGDFTRLADVGIEVDRHGAFQLDTDTLTAALESSAEDVARLFSTYGTTGGAGLAWVDSSDATESGDYTVDITTAATRAGVTGAGFGGGTGLYQDDGTSDTLTLRDLDTNSSYSVQLSDGDDLATIVDALNAELGRATARRLESSSGLYSDAGGTAASDDTLLSDLHDAGGVAMGVAAGDTFTISGTRADGSSFLADYTVTDPAATTVGDVLAQVRDQVGPDVTVRLDGGLVTLEENETGRSSLTLALSSDNAGGGSFTVGSIDATVEGRGAANITAEDAAGELHLTHADHGSAEGFEVSFLAGGTDGSASLGVAAGTYTGGDVAGTIGGYAATGSGRVLTGADGTAVEGLMLTYSGTDTGDVGTATFSRGIAARMEQAIAPTLESTTGTIDGVTKRIAERVAGLNDRIDELDERLEVRREGLIRRFTAMEQAMAMAQSQSAWLAGQLASLSQSKS